MKAVIKFIYPFASSCDSLLHAVQQQKQDNLDKSGIFDSVSLNVSSSAVLNERSSGLWKESFGTEDDLSSTKFFTSQQIDQLFQSGDLNFADREYVQNFRIGDTFATLHANAKPCEEALQQQVPSDPAFRKNKNRIKSVLTNKKNSHKDMKLPTVPVSSCDGSNMEEFQRRDRLVKFDSR